MLINIEKSNINNDTLHELFNCIQNSSCPEAEAEYLAKEFHIKTDELFLMYLENKKNLVTQQKNIEKKLVISGNQIVTHERRKSSSQFRLKYGVLKLLNEATAESVCENKPKNKAYKIKSYLEDELSRYNFKQKLTGSNVSTLDVLDNLRDLDLDLKYVDFMANEILAKILEKFEVYVPTFRSYT
jgi:hypothetical protein